MKDLLVTAVNGQKYYIRWDAIAFINLHAVYKKIKLGIGQSPGGTTEYPAVRFNLLSVEDDGAESSSYTTITVVGKQAKAIQEYFESNASDETVANFSTYYDETEVKKITREQT